MERTANTCESATSTAGSSKTSSRSKPAMEACRSGLVAGTLSSVQAASTSGDFRIAGRFAGPGPFIIETVSGDGLLAPAGDVQVQMTSVTGDLNSEFDGPTVTRGRRSLTIGRSGPVVSFRSMSGDLHVVRPVAASAPMPEDHRTAS